MSFPREGSKVRIGSQIYVFRANPPRLEPVGTAAGQAGRRPNDFSTPGVFSMAPVKGVRDVNEAY